MSSEFSEALDGTASAPLSPPIEGFWSGVREALRGSRRDYTQGPIGRAILVLAVPMVLEMVMESVFAVCDVFFVSRLGADAVATVGLTESMLTIIYSLAMGLAIGATAMVARRIGEGDRDGAAHTASQAIWLGVILSAVIGIPGAILAPRLLALMGASDDVIAVGSGFTRVMFAGNASILLLFLINAVFRGAGDATVAMRSLWIANAANLVLCPSLIFGLGPFPALGVTGAAVGTTLGRFVGVAYQLRALAASRGRLRIERRHVRVDRALMLHLAKVSVGGVGQFLIATASWLGLVRILTPFGAAALAGYTIALRVIVVALLPSWGMSNAVATLVGQNLGARKPERAARSVRLVGLYNMSFLLAVMAVFLLWAEPLVAVFTSDPEVRRLGAQCLRVVSYGYGFYAWGMVLVQAFNGAGDTRTPTLVNLGCYWCFQLPLALTLARGLELGPLGVFLAITVAESLLAVVGLLVFRRGGWKRQVV